MNDIGELMELAIRQNQLPLSTWFVLRSPDSVVADHVIREIADEIGAKVGATVAACRADEVPADELWLAHPMLDHFTIHRVPGW